jgi:AraC-like DNA-binding protein
MLTHCSARLWSRNCQSGRTPSGSCPRTEMAARRSSLTRLSSKAPVAPGATSSLARGQSSVEVLASRVGMPPRTFARQFRLQAGTTPHQWVTHLRLLAAQRRLERTRDSIDEVAEAVGWQTAATLRRHFGKPLGTTPTTYRCRFAVS